MNDFDLVLVVAVGKLAGRDLRRGGVERPARGLPGLGAAIEDGQAGEAADLQRPIDARSGAEVGVVSARVHHHEVGVAVDACGPRPSSTRL